MVMTRFPYPTDKGDKLRAYYQVQELSKKFNVYLLSTVSSKVSKKDIAELKKYCQLVEVFSLSAFQVYFSLLRAVFSSLPFQSYYFFNKRLKKRLGNLIEEKNIELVYVQLIRSFLNIPFGYNCKYYLDYMDAFSLGMKKRAEHTKFPLKLIVKAEQKRLEYLERKVAYYFHGTSIITEQDAKVLEGFVPTEIDVVPNGIDERFSISEEPVNKDIDIVFVGNMGYFPNVLACKYLGKEIVPVLQNEIAKLSTYLVGTDPAPQVKALQSKNIKVTGRVAEVQPYLCRSKVFVAPMYAGQGMQNKILEAMSMGLPVLTTPLAASAFKDLDSSGIIVCKKIEDFIIQIKILLNDAELRKELGEKSISYVESYYRWNTATASLLDKFERLIESNHRV